MKSDLMPLGREFTAELCVNLQKFQNYSGLEQMEDLHAAAYYTSFMEWIPKHEIAPSERATEWYASHVARRIIKPRYFHRIQNMQLSHLDYSTVLPNTETYIVRGSRVRYRRAGRCNFLFLRFLERRGEREI